MKIDLSKYPPGTKLKLKNGEIVFLIGKCYTKEHESEYVIEHNGWQALGYRRRDGTHPLCESPQYIESVIQPNKYLVSFCRKDSTLNTEIITEPQALTAEYLLTNLQNRFTLGALGDSIPVKILSWSKIEE